MNSTVDGIARIYGVVVVDKLFEVFECK